MATTYINPFVFAGEELGGMVLLTPSSIAYTGGGSETATTLANGSVEFTACATLSLNGVFSADYDNYMVGIRHLGSTTSALLLRLRTTVDASSSNYIRQFLQADGSSVTAARSASPATSARMTDASATQRTGDVLNIYGPFLTQPTAFRNVGASGESSASIQDYACTHDLSTSYSGISFICNTGTFDGLVSVYGLVGA